jgi:hypothetical protein
MSRSYGKGQRSRTRLNILSKSEPYADANGMMWRSMAIQGTLTESSAKILGSAWHTHHNSRLAERKSKKHAKQNEARRNRREGKSQIREQFDEE